MDDVAAGHRSSSPPSNLTSRLLLVLVVLAAARVIPVCCVEHVSPDAVEFLDIARNMRETGKPLLSVKAYYYAQTPITHYGGYERPLLPALLLGLGSARARSPILGAQWVSFAFSLLTAWCLILFLRKIYGCGPALAGGLLVGLAPPVLTASLYPWSDMLSLFACVVALLILAEFHPTHPDDAKRSGDAASDRASLPAGETAAELMVGIAIGAAAAMRAVSLVMVVPVAVYFIAMRRSTMSRLRALVLLMIGPALFVAANAWVNVANNAPALLLPQGFLYRVRSFDDGILHWAQRHAAPSVPAFLAANLPAVIRQVVKQTIAYAYILLFHHGWLFVWWVAAPLVAAGIWRRRLHPLAAVALGVAALNFAVYALSWATYDASRFLLVTLALLLPICVGEVFQAWGTVRLPISLVRSVTLPHLLVGGTLVVFGLLAARESYTALRADQARIRFRPYGETGVWNDPALPELCGWLNKNLGRGDAAVASPFPWTVNYLSARPCSFWPADLDTADKLAEYLEAYPVAAVVFDPRTRAADVSLPLLRRDPEWRESAVGRLLVFTRLGNSRGVQTNP